MARYNDCAPVKPTCPIINGIIDNMEAAKNEAEYLMKNLSGDYSEYARVAFEELHTAIVDIELVRDANSELRDWGNEQFERAEYAEKELELAQIEVEELKEELEYLKEQLETEEI